MRFLICADIITGLCLLALAAAVAANFAASRKPHAIDERRSPVATATMTAFGVLVYSFSFRYLSLFPQERELEPLTNTREPGSHRS